MGYKKRSDCHLAIGPLFIERMVSKDYLLSIAIEICSI